MRSDTHKVLHPIASRPLLLHLLDRVDALGADKRVVVVGKGREQVEAAIAGPRCDDRASGRAERHRTRGPAGASGARRLRRAGPHPLRRHALRRGGDAAADDRPSRRRRRPGSRRARILPGRSREIRPDHPRRGRPHREDGRISRCDRGGARGPPVQFGNDGGARRATCSAGSPKSATTMRPANITSPTWSTSPPRRAARRS